LDNFRKFLGKEVPLRVIPPRVDNERLLGGLDLAATLRCGRPVAQLGILAGANGGVVLLAMAERVETSTAAHLARALDTGEIANEHAGLRLCASARIGLIAFDEGIDSDEGLPAALWDRVALIVDLSAIALRDIAVPSAACDIAGARSMLGSVAVGEDVVEAFCTAALSLGISSIRVPLLALRVARVAAALEARKAVSVPDATLASRLVIAPRATVLPKAASDLTNSQDERELGPSDNDGAELAANWPSTAVSGDRGDPDQAIGEIVLAAAEAAVPSGLLDKLAATGSGRAVRPGTGGGRIDALGSVSLRGRPVGTRRGRFGGGARLRLAETLLAAAPWQRLRQGNGGAAETNGLRIQVSPQDFRLIRFKEPRRSLTIFVVDASGSAAVNRLAEAKGAVELLLAECYIRRDLAALLAFRGTSAELILPPTRSLARAKRCVVALPAGGGTPLATAVDAARELALVAQRRGEAPTIVILTDGHANISLDGTAGRARAVRDALDASERLRRAAVPALLCDVSRRSQPLARRLAEAMNANYLLLPDAKSATLSRAVRAAASR
jgi:magnesium chelatase subunit D